MTRLEASQLKPGTSILIYAVCDGGLTLTRHDPPQVGRFWTVDDSGITASTGEDPRYAKIFTVPCDHAALAPPPLLLSGADRTRELVRLHQYFAEPRKESYPPRK